MRNEHLSEETLIDLYYGERVVGSQEHLASCEECRTAAKALARTLSFCNEWTGPEPERDFGRDVWMRLAPQLGEQRPKAWWRRFEPASVRVAVGGFAMAALLVAVFTAGRYFERRGSEPVAVITDQAQQRMLNAAVADHLERVQVLLTEIANGDSSDPSRFAADRERAQNLVQEDRLIRQTVLQRGEQSTGAILDDVERFLTEASHEPEAPSREDVLSLRDRMDSDSLLFKVRVVETNLRDAGEKSEGRKL